MRSSSSAAEEVGEQALAVGRQHRLGVELEALRGKLAVADGHHYVAVARSALELRRQTGVGDERVVAPGAERVRDAVEQAAAVVLDLRVLAVDRLAAHGAAAERLDHRLVAETD